MGMGIFLCHRKFNSPVHVLLFVMQAGTTLSSDPKLRFTYSINREYNTAIIIHLINPFSAICAIMTSSIV